ncbi:hypothetical protein [Streptomyces sp. AP-93]|uniref:hypothetical protein n=1 Tax=Streptomyces sp. AP-93 TaxID=2929048 RepID=UPI001FAF847D|nr:hypothetical protein [Streptomyces sp. AP-93]MCJ0874303.1 hypothetical protein [Streptomyces sp. AP-93]
MSRAQDERAERGSHTVPAATGPDRYRLPVDVHLLLVRYGPDGGEELLLSRRAGALYAAGLWHAPSGLFFEALAWQGIPEVREPDVCDAMDWYSLDALPEPMFAYCRAALDAYRADLPGAVHFQEPGDPIPHHPDAPDRTRQLPGPARAPRAPGPPGPPPGSSGAL